MIPLELKKSTLNLINKHIFNFVRNIFYWVSNVYLARGVMVIIVGNEHGDTSSNPGLD